MIQLFYYATNHKRVEIFLLQSERLNKMKLLVPTFLLFLLICNSLLVQTEEEGGFTIQRNTKVPIQNHFKSNGFCLFSRMG